MCSYRMRWALSPSVAGRVKEMLVVWVSRETSWTIMSMLMPASAMWLKISAALPGTSGTPVMVSLPSESSWATPEMMGCSKGSPSLMVTVCDSSGRTQVPSLPLKEERTCSFTPKRRAYSTLRRCSTLEPAAAISNMSSLVIVSILCAVLTTRGSAGEDAVDVGIDLAGIGVKRSG